MEKEQMVLTDKQKALVRKTMRDGRKAALLYMPAGHGRHTGLLAMLHGEFGEYETRGIDCRLLLNTYETMMAANPKPTARKDGKAVIVYDSLDRCPPNICYAALAMVAETKWEDQAIVTVATMEAYEDYAKRFHDLLDAENT